MTAIAKIRLMSIIIPFFEYKVSPKEMAGVLARVADNSATRSDKDKYISFIQDLIKCI